MGNDLRVGLVVVALSVLAAACGPGTGSTTTTTAAVTTTTAAAPSTSAAVTTTTAVAPSTTAVMTTTTAAPSTTTTAVTTTTVATTTTTLPSGPPSPTCLNGWITPVPGTPLRTFPLDMIRPAPGELFIVDEMRYFVGPEDPNIIAPRRDVERWYVKAHLQSDPSYAARWLIRRVDVGAGVFGIAPFDSTGYAPGTWLAFEDGGGTSTAYPGIPGLHTGTPYDPFETPCTVPGDTHCTGPGPEVMGCLDGT